jgi:hypothetical protein
MSLTIVDSGMAVMDPSDIRRFRFDWDSLYLASGVAITTSTFTITPILQNGATVLTKDSESIVPGGRFTQLRLNATTASNGDSYQVNNKIVTDESPAQTIERSFKVLIQQR